MQGYKITARFYSPMVFYDPPILDALVLYCLARVKIQGVHRCSYLMPYVQERGDAFDAVDDLRKCIKYHHCGRGIFLSSQMQYDENTEYLDSWKKRFESKHVSLADFGNARRRIDTASGKYRSYNMPLPAHIINTGWWYFIGDGESVAKLLDDHIVAIGKKRAHGFGWIREWKIEDEPNIKAADILRMRPIPLDVAEICKINGGITRPMAWKPPYWGKENQTLCRVPV